MGEEIPWKLQKVIAQTCGWCFKSKDSVGYALICAARDLDALRPRADGADVM